jgi:site-specific DNA recombinase
LKSRFYFGLFQWSGQSYPGRHSLFVNPQTSSKCGHNRPKYSKKDIAFRGMMQCAYDGCMVTGEVQKAKYVYYRCTGHRGKCDLPRFREEDTPIG